MTAPEIHSTFSITSGGFCFGTLTNYWAGASKPITQDISQTKRQATFNVPARNWTWNVFRLLDAEGCVVTGWFVCHSLVDPEVEIDRILRVSEATSESDPDSVARGVLVFNKLDWGEYALSAGEARRVSREIGAVAVDPLDPSPAVGVGDWAQAKAQIQEWRTKTSQVREPSAHAVWMCIPRGEDIKTVFSKTFFPGRETTLRRDEKHADRYARYIREGWQGFQGIDWLNGKQDSPPDGPNVKRLAEGVLLGPYDKHEHVLRPCDVETLRLQTGYGGPPPSAKELQRQKETGILRGRETLGFMSPLEGDIHDLVNEMVLSFLEQALIPRLASGECDTVEKLAGVLFPGARSAQSNKDPDFIAYDKFLGIMAPLYGVDKVVAKQRMVKYLNSRLPLEQQVGVEDPRIKGLLRLVVYMLGEVFYVAHSHAVDQERDKIVPADIRMELVHWPWFWERFKFSRVLWSGR